MVTNVCKVTLGRLRPHFIAVCSPNITVSGYSVVRVVSNHVTTPEQIEPPTAV